MCVRPTFAVFYGSIDDLACTPEATVRGGRNGDRYGAFHHWQTWRDFVCAAGFVELSHFCRPKGLPRDQQPWLPSV
jgi:hypothetical protein